MKVQIQHKNQAKRKARTFFLWSMYIILFAFSAKYLNAHSSYKNRQIPQVGTALDKDTLLEEEESHPQIFIKNHKNYSKKFVRGLRELKPHKRVDLIDDLLILDQTDSTTFSKLVPIGKLIALEEKQGDTHAILNIKKVNYTSIRYEIKIIEQGKTTYTKKGIADILSTFFLAAEFGLNPITGEEEVVSVFYDYHKNDGIRIALGDDSWGSCLMFGNVYFYHGDRKHEFYNLVEVH